jgi:hypothetical protein
MKFQSIIDKLHYTDNLLKILKEDQGFVFTSDHIRVLASWSEKLNLKEHQKSLFTLYHDMTTKKNVKVEEINSRAMSAIEAIRYKESDKTSFYKTMKSWGLN